MKEQVSSREEGRHVHSDFVGGEEAAGGIVVESAEEVLVADDRQGSVRSQRVDDAFAFDRLREAPVDVVGEEHFLGPVEEPASAHGLLRPVVPPAHQHHSSPCVLARRAHVLLLLYLLNASDVRGCSLCRRPQHHALPGCGRQGSNSRQHIATASWMDDKQPDYKAGEAQN